MADRQKSKDMRRETEEVLGEKPEQMPEAPDQQGAVGGELQRKIGSRDEKKRLDETSAGATRPLAQDQDGSGSKEKV